MQDVENAIDRLRCNDSSWTVWLPVSGSASNSTLLLVTHTHAMVDFAQTLVRRQCKRCPSSRAKSSIEERGRRLEELARSRGMEDATLVRLAAQDASAWMFRGATWHASFNDANDARIAFQARPTRVS